MGNKNELNGSSKSKSILCQKGVIQNKVVQKRGKQIVGSL